MKAAFEAFSDPEILGQYFLTIKSIGSDKKWSYSSAFILLTLRTGRGTSCPS
jgi:hypothetical protein